MGEEMDIRGIRNLNLAGTIIFGIFGVVIPMFYLFGFGFIFWMVREGGFLEVCVAILITWIIVIGFLSYHLYLNTVVGLDRGNFEAAKRWILIGAVMGFIFAGGIITFVIFLISYVSFDDAVWPKPYYYPPPGYYPYPPPYPYGAPYPAQQPTGINPCPNCGQALRYVIKYQKWYCNNCKVYIKS